MNTLKARIKIARILLFLTVFIWQQISNFKKTGSIFSFKSIGIGLGFGALVFVGISIYGIVLDLVRYYVVAIIITLAIILSCCFKLDAFIASIPFLTEDLFLWILIAISFICMIRDIFIFKKIKQLQSNP